MYITLLGSFYNLGYQKALHTEICGLFGWRLMSWIGMGVEVLIVLYLGRMWRWMEEGITEVAK